MYPITTGIEEAKSRIKSLSDDGHHAEALIAGVFTVEKTMRRVLRQLILSAGFNSKQTNKYMKRVGGLNAIKDNWEFFDPKHRKLTSIIEESIWRDMTNSNTGFSYMRNQMVHGIRTFNLVDCKNASAQVLIIIDGLVKAFKDEYDYDGWERAKSRRTSKLHIDPKVKIK